MTECPFNFGSDRMYATDKDGGEHEFDRHPYSSQIEYDEHKNVILVIRYRTFKGQSIAPAPKKKIPPLPPKKRKAPF